MESHDFHNHSMAYKIKKTLVKEQNKYTCLDDPNQKSKHFENLNLSNESSDKDSEDDENPIDSLKDIKKKIDKYEKRVIRVVRFFDNFYEEHL